MAFRGFPLIDQPAPGLDTARSAGMVKERSQRWFLSRDFRLVWWSQIISQAGDGITKLALLWFVYAVTGSPLKTTVIGLLQTLPPILFGPFIGVGVDRLSKKWLMIGSDVLRAVLIGAIPCLISVEAFTVERLYVLVFLHAVASAVFAPALTASVPFLVSRVQYTAANALLQSTTSLGMIVGPALSGVGIALLGPQEVLCFNAATYLGSALCLLPIRVVLIENRNASRSAALRVMGDLIEGVRFALVRQPRVLLLILTASLYTFGTSAFSTLFPVFGRKLLGLGPMEVGYLWSAMGAGLLLVSLGLVTVTGWELRQRFFVIAASSAISSAALWGMAWVRDQWSAALMMGLIGIGLGVLTPVAWGILQEISPAGMVGRVLAIYSTAAMASAIAGMTVFGWITQRLDERAGVIGIGLVMAATATLAWLLGRWVRVRGMASLGAVPDERPQRRIGD